MEALIEVDNPNKAPVKNMKLKDLDGAAPAPMTRKEREEKEKEAKDKEEREKKLKELNLANKLGNVKIVDDPT